jgi:hypothetical protein
MRKDIGCGFVSFLTVQSGIWVTANGWEKPPAFTITYERG